MPPSLSSSQWIIPSLISGPTGGKEASPGDPTGVGKVEGGGWNDLPDYRKWLMTVWAQWHNSHVGNNPVWDGEIETMTHRFPITPNLMVGVYVHSADVHTHTHKHRHTQRVDIWLRCTPQQHHLTLVITKWREAVSFHLSVHPRSQLSRSSFVSHYVLLCRASRLAELNLTIWQALKAVQWIKLALKCTPVRCSVCEIRLQFNQKSAMLNTGNRRRRIERRSCTWRKCSRPN